MTATLNVRISRSNRSRSCMRLYMCVHVYICVYMSCGQFGSRASLELFPQTAKVCACSPRWLRFRCRCSAAAAVVTAGIKSAEAFKACATGSYLQAPLSCISPPHPLRCVPRREACEAFSLCSRTFGGGLWLAQPTFLVG